MRRGRLENRTGLGVANDLENGAEVPTSRCYESQSYDRANSLYLPTRTKNRKPTRMGLT